jgi:hypothetical protein
MTLCILTVKRRCEQYYFNFALEVIRMAKNTHDGYRRGAVDNRSQVFNPVTNQWVKRNTNTGRFMDVKQDGKPFKGVRKEG